MGKVGQKLRSQNGGKMGFGAIFLFLRLWAIFSPFRAESHFLFVGQFLGPLSILYQADGLARQEL